MHCLHTDGRCVIPAYIAPDDVASATHAALSQFPHLPLESATSFQPRIRELLLLLHQRNIRWCNVMSIMPPDGHPTLMFSPDTPFFLASRSDLSKVLAELIPHNSRKIVHTPHTVSTIVNPAIGFS